MHSMHDTVVLINLCVSLTLYPGVQDGVAVLALEAGGVEVPVQGVDPRGLRLALLGISVLHTMLHMAHGTTLLYTKL